jgi:hypothetical protein
VRYRAALRPVNCGYRLSAIGYRLFHAPVPRRLSQPREPGEGPPSGQSAISRQTAKLHSGGDKVAPSPPPGEARPSARAIGCVWRSPSRFAESSRGRGRGEARHPEGASANHRADGSVETQSRQGEGPLALSSFACRLCVLRR